MLDRGRPLSLWGSWWIAIQLLRPAFSRLSTFMWFATIVAGITVRADTLGVTSIVRALQSEAQALPPAARPFSQHRRQARSACGFMGAGGVGAVPKSCAC